MSKRPIFLIGLSFLAATAAVIIINVSIAPLLVVVCLIMVTVIAVKNLEHSKSLLICLIAVSVALLNLFVYTKARLEPLQIAQGERIAVKCVLISKTRVKSGYNYAAEGYVLGQKGKVRINLYGGDEQFDANVGDTLDGVLVVTESFSNTGNLYKLAKGEDMQCNLLAVAKVGRVEGNLTLYHRMMIFRDSLLRGADRLYSGELAQIVKAMTLGDMSDMSQTLNHQLNRSGLKHITVVSGTHISIICMAVLSAMRTLKINPRKSAAIMLFVIPPVVMLQAMTPSVLRAGIMMGVYCVAQIFFKEYDSYGALGLSAIVVLVINPYNAVNIGFLLSFLSVLGINMFAKKMESFFVKSMPKPLRNSENPILGITVSTFAVSIAANLLTLPLQIYTFGLFPAVGLLVSAPGIILSTPIISLGLVSMLILQTPLAPVAMLLSWIVKPLAGMFLLLVKLASVVPPIRFTPDELYVYPMLLGFYIVGGVLLYRKKEHLYKMAAMLCALVMVVGTFSHWLIVQGVTHVFAYDNAVLFIKDGKGAILGSISSEYYANIFTDILDKYNVQQIETLVVAENIVGRTGAVYFVRGHQPKTLIAAEEGKYTPHLAKSFKGEITPLQEGEIVLLEGITANITLVDKYYQTDININGKKLLKYQSPYDIIDVSYCDVVIIPGAAPMMVRDDAKIKKMPLNEGCYFTVR